MAFFCSFWATHTKPEQSQRQSNLSKHGLNEHGSTLETALWLLGKEWDELIDPPMFLRSEKRKCITLICFKSPLCSVRLQFPPRFEGESQPPALWEGEGNGCVEEPLLPAELSLHVVWVCNALSALP